MCGLGAEKNQMGEADEGSISSSSMTLNLSLQLDKYPRDLLQRFMSSTHQSNYRTPEEETEELELNLGLSLSGQFGVDRSPKNKLTRSSSVAGLVPLVCPRGDDSLTPPRGSYPPLMRTASLPTETEEWRKRKEIQMLRRMAAKKRRLEKQRSWNSKAEKDGGCGGGEEVVASRRACDAVAPPFRLPSWAQVVLGSGDKGGGMGSGGGSGRVQVPGPQTSQGSAESQGGSSSGMSESDRRTKQESGSRSRARSPVNCQLLQDRVNKNEPADWSGARKKESMAWASRPDTESPSKKPEPMENRGKEIGINAMEDMPCVFTKGDGPNGRRIEGILYKYGKGEEVRIICVCHGSFLSPAEFVKHAGGSDVAHPLRHIVINPNPSFMR